MISDSPQSRELPLGPTLLCLWAAGWVTSIVTSFLFLGRAYSTTSSPAIMVAANLLLTAAIGAVVVRGLLLGIVDCELPYGAILVALVAGSAASTAVRLVFFSELRHSGSTAVLPVAGLGLSFIPAIAGALVSYWLLQNAAASQRSLERVAAPDLPVAEPRRPQVATASDSVTTAYGEAVSAARESALGLLVMIDDAAPDSVPGVISDGMVGLEVATKRLAQAVLPAHVSAGLNQRLVEAMKQLEEDVIRAAQIAATTGGGGRCRWELEQSEGLRAVRQALDDLEALGFGPSS